MKKAKFLAFLLGTVLVVPSAFGQTLYPTPNATNVPGAAILVPKADGSTGAFGQPIHVPLSTTNALPTYPGNPPAGTVATPVPVAPQSYTATASFTIANASAHATNDVVGATPAALTFAGICPAAGREIILTSTRLRYDAAAIPTGMTSFRLYLYNVTPPSAYADDAPWQLLVGDRASFLGYLDLGSPVLPSTGSTSLIVETNGNQKQVTCASTSLFGYFVTGTAYTTAASTVSLVLKAVAP